MIGRTRFVVIAAATTLALVGCGTESSSTGEADDPTAAAEARVAELEAEMDERAAEAEARVAELETQIEELTEQADAEESVASTTAVPTEPLVTEAPAPPATSAAPPATPPPPPSDPFLIPPGVIEDGYHVGYLVSQSATSFSFDRADIQDDGTWKNVNPKVRTLPVSTSANLLYGAPPGTPIELFVSSQHVDWVVSLGG